MICHFLQKEDLVGGHQRYMVRVYEEYEPTGSNESHAIRASKNRRPNKTRLSVQVPRLAGSPPHLLHENTSILQFERTVLFKVINDEDCLVRRSQKRLRQEDCSVKMSRRLDQKSQQIVVVELPLDMNSSMSGRQLSCS